MKRATIVVVLVLAISTSACTTRKLSEYDDRLNTLHTELVSARRTGANATAIDQQLAQLARDASAEAARTNDAKTRVSLYRVAAVAAWQAGNAGETLVLPIVDAGIAACGALPQQDSEAPRDCSLIRLSQPMAVQDDLARDLIVLQQKRTQAQQDHQRQCEQLQGAEAAACRSTRGKLPATDLPAVKNLFGNFETQFSKTSEIRGTLSTLDVPPEFVTQTDHQRLIIYCNAVATWSLTADIVDGSQTFNALTPRKGAMAEQLRASGTVVDCNGVAPVQVVDQALLQP